MTISGTPNYWGPEGRRSDHRDDFDSAAVAKYEQQIQDAFDAEAEHRDCACRDEANPFCKTHAG